MHERAAVSAALGSLMEETGGALSRVVAVIGPGVDPQVVTGIWEETVVGTAAGDAELVLRHGAARVRCLSCLTDYSGDKLDPCPACGGDGLVIEQPPEFAVESWVGVS